MYRCIFGAPIDMVSRSTNRPNGVVEIMVARLVTVNVRGAGAQASTYLGGTLAIPGRFTLFNFGAKFGLPCYNTDGPGGR